MRINIILESIDLSTKPTPRFDNLPKRGETGRTFKPQGITHKTSLLVSLGMQSSRPSVKALGAADLRERNTFNGINHTILFGKEE